MTPNKDYSKFSQQLIEFANQARYDARREKSPDDMDVDQATRENQRREPAEPEYSQAEWAACCEEQLDWVGKGGN